MSTYKEQKEKRKAYVLLLDCEVIGVFGNLKELCNYLDGKDFYKYTTVVRKKEFPIVYKGYKIFKVKHH